MLRSLQRCNHIWSAERSCPALWGFARYCEAPASRHFSRSSFIAPGVQATTGSRRGEALRRIDRIVSYPFISSIMISVRTIARPGVDSMGAMASRPVPVLRTVVRSYAAFQRAAAGEDVANIVVHVQNLATIEGFIRWMQAVEHPLLVCRQVAQISVRILPPVPDQGKFRVTNPKQLSLDAGVPGPGCRAPVASRARKTKLLR